jgi:hypothetical protein
VSGGAVLLLRRPFLVAFVLGCGVSVLASGRFTLRLIVDGTLSMAFVPACQMLGFAAVYPFRRTPVSFASAVDRFFAGNTVWLAWMLVFMVLGVVLPVTGQGQLEGPFLISSIVPILWSVAVDRRFFADVIGRTGWRGGFDIAIERLVAWLAAIWSRPRGAATRSRCAGDHWSQPDARCEVGALVLRAHRRADRARRRGDPREAAAPRRRRHRSRTNGAAIGSSDFHGPGRLSLCRTFVFARENTAAAILEAIRAKRTVVYGRDGQAYGDESLIRLVAIDGRVPAAARRDYSYGWLDRVGQVVGLAGVGLLILGLRGT